MSPFGYIAAAGIVLVSVVAIGTASHEEQKILSAYIESEDITPTPTTTPTPTNTPIPTSTPLPTPTNTPTPTPIPYTSQNLEEWFTRYSGEYGVDRELLRKIAACESGFNATSYNATHDYAGMYQYSASTWISTRTAMGFDTNINLRFNPEEAIRTSAFKISRGGAGAWPNCSK